MSKVRDRSIKIGVLMRENGTTSTTQYGTSNAQHFGSTLDAFCTNYEPHFNGVQQTILFPLASFAVLDFTTNRTANV